MSSNDTTSIGTGSGGQNTATRSGLARLYSGWGSPILRFMAKTLPFTRSGDRLFALVHFMIRQRRLPQRRMLFNDYLLRLKLSGELLSFPRQFVSDKEYCKLYVNHVIGSGRTVPTVSVLRDKAQVQEGAFPDDCVIKATHSSNRTTIRRNAEPLDLEHIRSYLDDSLYQRTRELNYKYLEPKVIVEPIMFDAQMIELKIHCYKGRAKIISVQHQDEALERLDRDWNRLAIEQRRRPLPAVPTPRPSCLEAVLEAADKLSQDFEYIRVDVFVRDPDWVVGELTNLHMNIDVPFKNLEQERLFSQIFFS